MDGVWGVTGDLLLEGEFARRARSELRIAHELLWREWNTKPRMMLTDDDHSLSELLDRGEQLWRSVRLDYLSIADLAEWANREGSQVTRPYATLLRRLADAWEREVANPEAARQLSESLVRTDSDSIWVVAGRWRMLFSTLMEAEVKLANSFIGGILQGEAFIVSQGFSRYRGLEFAGRVWWDHRHRPSPISVVRAHPIGGGFL